MPRRLLRLLIGAVLVPIILFEEWGWDPLLAAMARLARWPPLRAFERRLAALPPYLALASLLLPALTLLPLKLLALWLLADGEVLASVLLVIAAKLVGTAVVAWLFAITKPALMRLHWFAVGYARWTVWKAGWVAVVRATWAWRQGRELADGARRVWARWRRTVS